MSFDTLAPYYRTMELVLAGGVLQRCRMAFLAETKRCRQALLVGEGPGRFLSELVRSNPGIAVTCVERSPCMIKAAQRRLSASERTRVRFVPVDALTWEPPRGSFDAVVTNFFLDCFSPAELEPLIASLAAGATPEARWLLADFREPASGWRRWRARLVLQLMYGFFRAATGLSAVRITPPDEFLTQAGFRLVRRKLGSFGLLHSDLWERHAR